MSSARTLRIVAALALLVGGLIHLDLYFDGYRAIPDIGRGFLLNAVASTVIAAAVATRREWFVRAAGIGLAVGTLVAFGLSRRDGGLLKFHEQGLHPSPQAALTLIVEILAIALLALTFVPSVARHDTSMRPATLAAALGLAAVVVIGFGVSRSRSDDTAAAASTSSVPATPADGTATTIAGQPAAATSASAVTIKDFAFTTPTVTVAPGTTVTWTNADGVDHSIVAGDASFRSETLGEGATFAFTFATPGTFSYICGIHPYMAGTITVAG